MKWTKTSGQGEEFGHNMQREMKYKYNKIHVPQVQHDFYNVHGYAMTPAIVQHS
jgi:hypothetical protein